MLLPESFLLKLSYLYSSFVLAKISLKICWVQGFSKW